MFKYKILHRYEFHSLAKGKSNAVKMVQDSLKWDGIPKNRQIWKKTVDGIEVYVIGEDHNFYRIEKNH